MPAHATLLATNSDLANGVDVPRLQPIKEDGPARLLDTVIHHHPTHLSSALVTDEDEEDLIDQQYGVLQDLKQPSSRWSLRRPLPISVGGGAYIQHRAAKLRSYSETSASHPLFASSPFSPTETSFSSSPPSSPTFAERGRSPSHSSLHSHSPSPPPGALAAFPPPDPYRDITHLRLTARGNHVLYPGATFAGTQQSGRSNYQVDVTVLVCSTYPNTLLPLEI